MLNNQLVASYLEDAHTLVKVFNLDGRFVREVALPGLGTAGGPIIGAFMLYAFSRWFGTFVAYEPFAVGIVFLLALRFFPTGIDPMIRRSLRWCTRAALSALHRRPRAMDLAPAKEAS